MPLFSTLPLLIISCRWYCWCRRYYAYATLMPLFHFRHIFIFSLFDFHFDAPLFSIL
jgi:hypothetical protein